MKKGIPILTAVVLLGLVAAFTFGILLNRSHETRKTEPSGTPSEPSAPVEQPNDSEVVADILRGITNNPTSHLTDDLREEANLDIALPPTSTVEPIKDSWAPDGFGGGTMNTVLHVDGEPDEYYLVVLERINEEWKIAATFKQEVDQ